MYGEVHAPFIYLLYISLLLYRHLRLKQIASNNDLFDAGNVAEAYNLKGFQTLSNVILLIFVNDVGIVITHLCGLVWVPQSKEEIDAWYLIQRLRTALIAMHWVYQPFVDLLMSQCGLERLDAPQSKLVMLKVHPGDGKEEVFT